MSKSHSNLISSESDESIADKFLQEKAILVRGLERLSAIWNSSSCSGQEFDALVMAYARLLQRARNQNSVIEKQCGEIQSLREMALQDALTGIHNRRYMEENLRRTIKTLCRSGGELGILMVDVDYFKKYNDLHGHSKGDESLKRVAVALKHMLTRADDFVARYGGEEFIIILPNTGEKGTRIMAEKTLEQIRACCIPYEQNGEFSVVTVSVGATSGKVTPDGSVEEAIRRADEALYLAKNSGRNRSVFLKIEKKPS
ncbi:GGDEF domain-containing protein [Desulfovibrio sp. OttesenSCG-928-I05]|nr:GGDEF domain-containing protein [Desulfovibrio sp. OttesenSCG-928-I05]